MAQGKVLKLFYTCNDAEKTRVEASELALDTQGVQKDKFYGKNALRSVLITSLESYALAKKNNIQIPHGVLGENILIDINPYSLLPGDTLKIGEVTLQITQNCTLCKGLSSVHSQLPKLLKTDRGIFATVVSDAATIHVGDTVTF